MEMVQRKFRRIVLTLLCLAFCCNVFSQASFYGYYRDSDCVVDVARGELGVRETSANWSPRIKQYLNAVGINRPAYWCAAFVAWCLDQCGIYHSISAWSPTAARKNVIYRRNARRNQTPRAGDVGTLYYSNLGRVGHAFIIEHWGNKVITIEGNGSEAGSRNGVAVVRRVRMKSTIYAVSRWTID